MKKVLLLGEPLGLLIADEYGRLQDVNKFTKKVAGAELNVAVGLSRLGYKVEYFTKIGKDPLGENIKKFLEKEKIGTKYLIEDKNYLTGLQLKGKIEDGDPEIYYYRKNSAATTVTRDDIDVIDLTEFDLIHITGIPLGISYSFRDAIFYLIEKAKKLNKIITFDPNIRMQMWSSVFELKMVMNTVCRKANLILPGIGECELLIDERDPKKSIQKYLDEGIENIVLKNGTNGSYFSNKEGSVFVKSFKVKAVDTVGAGDGFAVGVISGLLENLPKKEILQRANAIGAIQVCHISDNEGLPTRQELEEFINSHK